MVPTAQKEPSSTGGLTKGLGAMSTLFIVHLRPAWASKKTQILVKLVPRFHGLDSWCKAALRFQKTTRVEVPKPNHLRDFVSIWRSVRWCNFFPCRKIEIERIVILWVIFSLDWNYCKFLKSEVCPKTLQMSRFCHNCPFWDQYLLTLALKTGGGRVSWHYRFLGDIITDVGDLGLVSI